MLGLFSLAQIRAQLSLCGNALAVIRSLLLHPHCGECSRYMSWLHSRRCLRSRTAHSRHLPAASPLPFPPWVRYADCCSLLRASDSFSSRSDRAWLLSASGACSQALPRSADCPLSMDYDWRSGRGLGRTRRSETMLVTSWRRIETARSIIVLRSTCGRCSWAVWYIFVMMSSIFSINMIHMNSQLFFPLSLPSSL
jgi:hypothetical protein